MSEEERNDNEKNGMVGAYNLYHADENIFYGR